MRYGSTNKAITASGQYQGRLILGRHLARLFDCYDLLKLFQSLFTLIGGNGRSMGNTYGNNIAAEGGQAT